MKVKNFALILAIIALIFVIYTNRRAEKAIRHARLAAEKTAIIQDSVHQLYLIVDSLTQAKQILKKLPKTQIKEKPTETVIIEDEPIEIYNHNPGQSSYNYGYGYGYPYNPYGNQYYPQDDSYSYGDETDNYYYDTTTISIGEWFELLMPRDTLPWEDVPNGDKREIPEDTIIDYTDPFVN